MSDDDIPRAEVTRCGRWTWSVIVLHGITQYGPNGIGLSVFGSRKRAERMARRLLAKYLARQVPRESFTVVSS